MDCLLKNPTKGFPCSFSFLPNQQVFPHRNVLVQQQEIVSVGVSTVFFLQTLLTMMDISRRIRFLDFFPFLGPSLDLLFESQKECLI